MGTETPQQIARRAPNDAEIEAERLAIAEQRKRRQRRETPQQIARRAPNRAEIEAEKSAIKEQMKRNIDAYLGQNPGVDPRQIDRTVRGTAGKFIEKAYADYQQPSPYAASLAVAGIERDPLLSMYRDIDVARATNKFKETHSWARKKKHAADLDVVVRYLLSKPKYRKTYYSP